MTDAEQERLERWVNEGYPALDAKLGELDDGGLVAEALARCPDMRGSTHAVRTGYEVDLRWTDAGRPHEVTMACDAANLPLIRSLLLMECIVAINRNRAIRGE